MRILLLTHLALPTVGGVQRSVHNLAQGLRARGHEVSVASHAPRPPGLPVVNRRDARVGLNVPSPFTFHPIETLRRPVLDALNLRTLRAWCRERRVEIVHAHLINVDTRYAFPAARAAAARVVVTLRGGETEHWLDAHPRRRDYVCDVLRRADYVTAVAESLLHQACALVPEVAGKSRVVRNPILDERLDRGAPAPVAPGRMDRPYLLFVGRLEDMKDVATLIEGYHLAAGTGDFAHGLVIVGDGSRRHELEARARRGDVQGRIRFAGELGYEDTLALMRDAAALVLPSVSSEGCPNVVLEAMALGTPVVVSDLDALVELSDDGRAGAVFRRGDPRSLASVLMDVASDEARRHSMAAAARALVGERHTANGVLAAYERIYRDVITGA